MTDQFQPAPAAPVVEDEIVETPLHAAAWLAQDMGVAMPPLPGIYLDAIQEFTMGSVFGTERGLAACKTREALSEALRRGVWPGHGLAFGFVAGGSGGLWFYTLVGEQSILQISLRISFYSQETTESGLAGVSAANRLLERYLIDETNYLRAINPTPPPPGAPRRVVAYSNESGIARETVAYWTAHGGEPDFTPQNEIFAPGRKTIERGGEKVTFRV